MFRRGDLERQTKEALLQRTQARVSGNGGA